MEFSSPLSRLFILGNTEESAKIDQIRWMVEEGDLTNLEIVQAIHNKNKELDPTAKAFALAVAELRRTNSRTQ